MDMIMARVPSTRNRSDQTTATNNRTTEVLESLKSELATLQEQVRVLGELQNDTRSFIAFLHMHLREAVERDEVAQARINSLERAEGARADGLVSEMAILEGRIAYLQKKWDKARDLERFTKLSATGEIRPWDLKWVDEKMAAIDFYMKQLLLDHDNVDHFEAPNLDNDADLTGLIRTVLGLNPQERVSTEKVRIQLSRLSLQSVVRALTAAAVCQWVFQAELPGMSLSDSVLLDEYRDHLITRGALSFILFHVFPSILAYFYGPSLSPLSTIVLTGARWRGCPSEPGFCCTPITLRWNAVPKKHTSSASRVTRLPTVEAPFSDFP
jgi:hypothetical protein